MTISTSLRFICLALLLAATAAAENLLRNASFEAAARDQVITGYNRYNPMRDPASLALATRPVETLEVDELRGAFGDELAGPSETDLGWHLVQESAERAFHGRRSLRCMKRGRPLGFGVETEGGWVTVSLYARSRETDVLLIRLEDIRGRKGEVRHEQKKVFTVGQEWTRCVFSAQVARGPLTVRLEMMGDGELQVDAMQLEMGDEATPFALHPWDQEPAAASTFAAESLWPDHVQNVTVTPESELLSGIAEWDGEGENQAGELPLSTWVPSGSPDGALPATGGVPLPGGMLFDSGHVAVVDADGVGIPAQFRVLSRRPADGSIRMVLVDVAGPLPSGSRLVFGPDVRPAPVPDPLVIEETPTHYELDTGRLRLRVSRRDGRGIEALWFDGEQVVGGDGPSGVFTQDVAGRDYWGQLGQVRQVMLEEAGPLRASLLIAGTHRRASGQDFLDYELRLHVYAGQAFLRLEHTFVNGQRPYASAIGGLGLRLPLTSANTQWLRWPGLRERREAGGAVHALIDGVGLRRWTGDVLRTEDADLGPGWLTMGGAQSALTVSLPEWRLMRSKEWVVDPETGLDICLWPRHMTGAFVAPVGLARSHRVWLQWHAAAQSDAAAAAWQAYFAEGARVETTAAVLSGADSLLGPVAVRDSERFPRVEAFVQRESGGRFPLAGEYQWEGDFLSYGDDRGDMGFGNMETMLMHAMWQLYARSLERWYYRRAAAAALHYRDVDICHPWGQARVHSHNHTLRPWDMSHAWIRGVLEHYLLTGDTRSLQVAHEHGRWIRSLPPSYKVATGSRRWTRCVQNLAALYEVTGQPAYRANYEARLAVAESLRGEARDVSRFALHHQAAGETSYGRLTMEQYYGLTSLMVMHRATGEERWLAALLDEMRFLLALAEAGGPVADVEAARRWGRRHGRRVSSARDRLVYPLLAYAYALTADERYSQAALQALFTEVSRDDWQDGFANLRYAGNVFAASALQLAVAQGLGPAEEAAMTQAATATLPDALRDPDFEGETARAWAATREIQAAATGYGMRIEMVDDVAFSGERSLRITEPGAIAPTPALDRQKRQTPYLLTANQLHLDRPGRYVLTGHVRWAGHGRPDVSLLIDPATDGERIELETGLAATLPAPVYDDLIEPTDTTPGDAKITADSDELPSLTAEKATVSDGRWYAVRYEFDLASAADLRVVLGYRFGLLPPGRVWFDAFALERLADRSALGAPPAVSVVPAATD